MEQIDKLCKIAEIFANKKPSEILDEDISRAYDELIVFCDELEFAQDMSLDSFAPVMRELLDVLTQWQSKGVHNVIMRRKMVDLSKKYLATNMDMDYDTISIGWRDMHLIGAIDMDRVLLGFELDEKLWMVKAEIVGPDDEYYELRNKEGKQFCVICRDYLSNLDAEANWLKEQYGLEVKKWYEIRGEKTWYNDESDVVNYLVTRKNLTARYECSFVLAEVVKVKKEQ